MTVVESMITNSQYMEIFKDKSKIDKIVDINNLKSKFSSSKNEFDPYLVILLNMLFEFFYNKYSPLDLCKILAHDRLSLFFLIKKFTKKKLNALPLICKNSNYSQDTCNQTLNK